MNKPKVDIGYAQWVIDLCAKDAPKGMCEHCAALSDECAEHQNEIKEGDSY